MAYALTSEYDLIIVKGCIEIEKDKHQRKI